jgi:hypothetical protein
VGALPRRVEAQGLVGLRPDPLPGLPAGRRRRGPAEVGAARQRLQGLSAGCGDRALARRLVHPGAVRLRPPSVQTLGPQRPPTAPRPLPRLASPSSPPRAAARREGLTRAAPGGTQRRLSRLLPVSRPPLTTWLTRCEAETTARRAAQRRAPPAPGRLRG